jgi:hypothetical protein
MKSIIFACAIVALLAFVTVAESEKHRLPLHRPYAMPVVLPVGAKPSKVVSRLLPKLLEGTGKNISIGYVSATPRKFGPPSLDRANV